MKRFLTTAAAAMVAMPALAAVELDTTTMLSTESLSDEARVYSVVTDAGGAWDDSVYYEALDPNWEDVGSVDDIILDRDGNLVGIVAEVGGFLGLGDTKVLLEPSEFSLLVDRDDDSYAVVTGMTKDMLSSRPTVEDDLFD